VKRLNVLIEEHFKYSCSKTYPTVDISMTKCDMFLTGKYVCWSTGLL